MDFMENIQLKKGTLTKNELKACEMICKDLKIVQMHSIQELSEEIGVAKTTIMRFCQKIGYSGYSEFRYALINYVNDPQNSAETKNDNTIANVAGIYADTIRLMQHTISDAEMEDLALQLLRAGKIYLAGSINSFVSAKQLYYSLLMFGIEASVLDSESAAKSVDMCVKKDDLIILYSVSGRSQIVKPVINLKEQSGCRLIMITITGADKDDRIDQLIRLPGLSVQRGSLLENIPVYTVFNEILITYISSLRKNSKE